MLIKKQVDPLLKKDMRLVSLWLIMSFLKEKHNLVSLVLI